MSSPTALLEKHLLENNSQDGWPSAVDMKVIVPGLVRYEDLINSAGEHVGGDVLVQKPALDKMCRSIQGKPIINWDHRKVDPKDYGKGKAQGLIEEMRFNERWNGDKWELSNDGWFHAKGFVWDESTKKNIERGHGISCAYTVQEWGDGGTHNKVPYMKEVLNGSYTHIAVVANPRYESARIELLNSGGTIMGLLSLFKKDKVEDKIEFDPITTKVPVEGVGEVSVQELVNSYKALHVKPAAPAMTDLVDVDGVKVPLSELANAHTTVLQNALKDEHESGKHKDSEKENCAMCNSAADEAKKKNSEEEVKNAADKVAAEKAEAAKKAEELANSNKTAEEKLKADALKKAQALEEMRNKGKEVKLPTVRSVSQAMAEGQRRYGTVPASK